VSEYRVNEDNELSEVRNASLSEQLDPTTPEYVNARLMELEQFFEQAPKWLETARNAVTVSHERYAAEKARAFLNAEGKNKEAREAQAFLATRDAREEWQVADAALRYLQDQVTAASRQKDALQTRSANLRAEIQLAGRGQA
jgi:TPR repeat protein